MLTNKDFQKEFTDYISQYDYMDKPGANWTSTHEAINQMVKSCFEIGGKVDRIKLDWILKNRCAFKTLEGLIESCFRGTGEKLLTNDSRLTKILGLIIRSDLDW